MWGSPRHLIPTFLGIGLAAAVPVGGCGDGAGGTRIASLPTGGEPVQLDPEVFSTRIDNPYWPMQPGERRVVSERGRRVEDNHAWFAQDNTGNVWYLGEEAREFQNGDVKTTKGSWEAGVDGAQPGVIMPAHPKVGLAYREEQYKGVAQDRARVSSRRERVEVPFRRFRRVLLIKETEPIEPELLDYKFYAKGVGPVLGVEVSGGSDRQELVSVSRRGT